LYDNSGEYEKAKEYYLKALQIRKDVLGENHPDTAASYGNLGRLYGKTGEYEKAKEYYLKVLQIRKDVLGENHPDTAASYNNLGHLYDNSGEYEKANGIEIVTTTHEKSNEHVMVSTQNNKDGIMSPLIINVTVVASTKDNSTESAITNPSISNSNVVSSIRNNNNEPLIVNSPINSANVVESTKNNENKRAMKNPTPIKTRGRSKKSERYRSNFEKSVDKIKQNKEKEESKTVNKDQMSAEGTEAKASRSKSKQISKVTDSKHRKQEECTLVNNVSNNTCQSYGTEPPSSPRMTKSKAKTNLKRKDYDYDPDLLKQRPSKPEETLKKTKLQANPSKADMNAHNSIKISDISYKK